MKNVLFTLNQPMHRNVLDCSSLLPLLVRTRSDEKAAEDCRSPRRWRTKRRFGNPKRDVLHGRVLTLIVALFAGAAGAAATNALQINIEEENVIFEGATAASCRIQLDAEPGAELLAAIQDGNADILGLELLRLGE